MTKQNIYLILAILGVALPYSLYLPWLLEHGFDTSLFIKELFANDIAGTAGLDILAVTIAIVIFIIMEGKNLKIKAYYIPACLTVLIGVGFGLPLYLWMRENNLNNA